MPILSTSLYAQREQIGVRYETWGNSDGVSDFTRVNLNAYSINLNASFRAIIGEEGETIVMNGFFYRFLDINLDFLSPKADPGGYPLANPIIPPPIKSQFHLLQYDLTAIHSLSDEWTAIIALRPGIFSDFTNITVNNFFEHFRFEVAGFADYVISSSFTIGVGLAIQPSNFGRVLPAIPLLHFLNNGNLFEKK